MKCPNCDAEMVEDEETPGLWYCFPCGFAEDRR